MFEITLHEDADKEFKAAIMCYESREAGLGQIFLERVSEGFEFVLSTRWLAKFCLTIFIDTLFANSRIRSCTDLKATKSSSWQWLTGAGDQGIGQRTD